VCFTFDKQALKKGLEICTHSSRPFHRVLNNQALRVCDLSVGGISVCVLAYCRVTVNQPSAATHTDTGTHALSHSHTHRHAKVHMHARAHAHTLTHTQTHTHAHHACGCDNSSVSSYVFGEQHVDRVHICTGLLYVHALFNIYTHTHIPAQTLKHRQRQRQRWRQTN